MCQKVTIHNHAYNIGLFKKPLYIYYSNAVLKEDMYVFEGQQLETLFDLLEEYKSALCNNSECENSLTSSYTEQVAKQLRTLMNLYDVVSIK